MIKEFEYYHGVIFTKLIHHSSRDISFTVHSTKSNASYVINEKVAIFIKHSTKRMSPWRFSFQPAHGEEIIKMNDLYNDVFITLVCGEDGIVLLRFNELMEIWSKQRKNNWISVSRSRNKEYTVKGTYTGLKYKIGMNWFPHRLLMTI